MIDALVTKLKRYSKPLVISSSKQFGDVLHASTVVRHYWTTNPGRPLIWMISERYLDEFRGYPYATEILGLPHSLETKDRRKLADQLRACSYQVIQPLCSESGWPAGASDIASAVLMNAGIKRLMVPRKTILPIDDQDRQWAREFLKSKGCEGRRYVTLEYNSYTLSKPPHSSTWPVEKYNQFVNGLNVKCVNLRGPNDPALDRGADGVCSFRQAKALIEGSSLFIGCGSGLTMVAATEGLRTRILEIGIGHSISMRGCQYSEYSESRGGTPAQIAEHVNRFVG